MGLKGGARGQKRGLNVPSEDSRPRAGRRNSNINSSLILEVGSLGYPAPGSLLKTPAHLPWTLLLSHCLCLGEISVCLTQRFLCKSHLIITRVRAEPETLWVKGGTAEKGRTAQVSRGQGSLGELQKLSSEARREKREVAF